MNIFYTHGLGGSLKRNRKLKKCFTSGTPVIRVAVPRHDTLLDVAAMLSTITLGTVSSHR
jgi:hypothetical protein